MTARGEGPVPATAPAATPAITVAGIALASILVPLNSTMIAVALPGISRDFDITTSEVSVLITLYLAGMLVGQPLAGRVADAVGARRLATIATSGFGLCSVGAMLAGSFGLLVAMRTLQAAFASALVPSVQSMLRSLVPAHERGRAFGVQGAVVGAGAGLGPVVGGLVIAAFSWRAVFGVNLPVVLVVLWSLRARVPPLPPEPHRDHESSGGAARVFSPVFTAACSVQALATFAQYALVLAVPIVLDGRGWSSVSIGAALSFLTLGQVLVGPAAGRLGDGRGRRWPVRVGLAAALVVVAAASLGGNDLASAALVGTLLIFGLGFGMASPSIQTAGIEAAPIERVGAAAGLLSAGRYVGSIASTLVLAEVVRDDGQGLRELLALSALSLAAAVAVARWFPGRVTHPHHDEPVAIVEA